MPLDSLTVFYPMWNEERSIHAAVEAAREACGALVDAGEVGEWEVLIVDDASTDTTGKLADQLATEDDRVRVVHHGDNRGLGGALKTGLANARGDLVLYTDADLPCDLLETLTKAVRLLRVYDADIVSAYRHDRTAEGPRRAVYSFVYNLLVRFLFRLRVRDVNFAFKLFRRHVLDQTTPRSEGSFIDAELLVRAHQLGFHTIQFGVDYFPRTRGVSTLSSSSTILTIVRELFSMRAELLAIRPGGPGPDPEPGTDPEADSHSGTDSDALPPSGSAGIANGRATSGGRDGGVRGRKRVADPEHDLSSQRLLIVNADDYGLTEGVARGVLRAHHEGVVTSTSVLAVAPAFALTGSWLAEAGDLGVGVHLALVGEDPPLLTAAEVPSLVDRQGRFPISWRVFLGRAMAGRVDPADIRREFEAQLARVQALGVPITHLDSHQHLHLWPAVRDVVVALAVDRGIGAVRVPRSATRFPGTGVNLLARQLAQRAGAAGLAYPAHAAGIDEAGALDASCFRLALGRLAGADAATVELSSHPGEADDPGRDRYRWGYRWGDELAALTDSRTRAAVDSSGFVLGTYADLAAYAPVGA